MVGASRGFAGGSAGFAVFVGFAAKCGGPHEAALAATGAGLDGVSAVTALLPFGGAIVFAEVDASQAARGGFFAGLRARASLFGCPACAICVADLDLRAVAAAIFVGKARTTAVVVAKVAAWTTAISTAVLGIFAGLAAAVATSGGLGGLASVVFALVSAWASAIGAARGGRFGLIALLVTAANGVGLIDFADADFTGVIGRTSAIFGAGIAVFALLCGALAVSARVGGSASVVDAALTEWTGTIEGAVAAIFGFVGFAGAVAATWEGDADLLAAITALACGASAINGASGASFFFVGIAGSIATVGGGQTSGGGGIAQLTTWTGAIEGAVEAVFLCWIADAVAATDRGL